MSLNWLIGALKQNTIPRNIYLTCNYEEKYTKNSRVNYLLENVK